MKEFGLGIVVAMICVLLFGEFRPKKEVIMNQTKTIDSVIIHRNDTVRIIDSAVKLKQLRVHKLSKKQVREEFDSAFAVDSAFVKDTAVDTMVIAVDQAKKCLELQAAHEGDSAKLLLDNRTLATVDSTVQQLNVVQETDWKHVGVGALIGALAALLLVMGTN